MSKRFQDKVVLVTASSTGIGLAMCEQFAKEGATVIVNSRNKQNVEEAVQKIRNQGGKAEGLICHAGKSSDILKLMTFIKEKYGRLDVLVPNAAVSTHVGMSLDMSVEQLDKLLEVNVKGTFMLIKYAQDLLEATPNSNVVIISSVAGYELWSGLGMYSITKTALIAMTKILSKEMGKIRVNCCAPGLIKTKFSALLWEGREQETINEMKVQRLGAPSDIAMTVAFLASEEASYINGETIVVAGKTSPRL